MGICFQPALACLGNPVPGDMNVFWPEVKETFDDDETTKMHSPKEDASTLETFEGDRDARSFTGSSIDEYNAQQRRGPSG